MKNKALLTLLALGLGAATLVAQEGPGPGNGDRPPRREGGPGGPGREGMRMPPPLMAALDANGDGVIDEQEIANASAALRKLDKNGDGKLTMEELRPPRPGGGPDDRGPRREGPPGGEGGARPNRPLPPRE